MQSGQIPLQLSAGNGPVLILDDDAVFSIALTFELKRFGIDTITASTIEEALRMVADRNVAAALVDVNLHGESGFDFLREMTRGRFQIPAIVVSASQDIQTAIQAMRMGAVDYMLKPVAPGDLMKILGRVGLSTALAERRRRRQADWERFGIFGGSAVLHKSLLELEMAAKTECNILITGESGCGKELFARAAHLLGKRANAPFVAVNCAALGESVFLSEMFGHRKGSFTGADEKHTGYLKAADGGTLFLDEVGEIPLAMQVKMLRAIETGEFNPVGEVVTARTDVRYVAATNRDLQREVESGHFRLDLYHRLNVIDIHIPPLRERREEIPALADHFLEKIAQETGMPRRRLLPLAAALLMECDWPGNVRQLQNALTRAVALSVGESLGTEDFVRLLTKPNEVVHEVKLLRPPMAIAAKSAVKDIEVEEINMVLTETRGDIIKAAHALKVSRATLYRKLAKYGLSPAQFKSI